jgi:PAS domain S-box-containing protein
MGSARRRARDFSVVGFALILALLVVGGVLGTTSLAALAKERRAVTHGHEVVAALESLLSTLKDAETGQRGYLLVQDEKYLKPYDDAVRRVPDEIAALEKLLSEERAAEASLARLRDDVSKKLAEAQRTIELARAGKHIEALEIVLGGAGRELMDDMRASVASMENTERETLFEAAANAEAGQRTLFLAILFPALAGVVLVSVVFRLSQRHARLREQTTREIAEERERLRTTLASIGDAVIATDVDGCITNMNSVAESLTGWSTELAIGEPLDQVFRIVNEETRRTVPNPAERALKEGVIVGLANHTVLIAKDGAERFIDDSAAPIRCKEGTIVGCVLVFRDVGDRRETESALRRSERELSDFFENATVGLQWVAADGTILRANPAELAMLGYAHDEFVGRNIAEFHVERDVVDDVLERLKHGESVNGLPARMRCKDGSIRDVLVSSNGLFENGAFVHSRCFTLDVTDRKRAEAELASELAAMTRLQSLSTRLVQVGDLESLLHEILAAAAELTHTTKGNIHLVDSGSGELRVVAHQGFGARFLARFGRRGSELVCGAAVQTRERVIWEDLALAPELRHSTEREVFLGEGVRSVQSTPLLARDGRLLGLLNTHYEIAHRPIDRELRYLDLLARMAADLIERSQIEQSLRDADRRKTEFLAMLAHELRNPLAPILNALQIIRLNEHGEAAPALKSASSMMDRQLVQLVRLVDDLLDVSRISRGKIELKRDRVALAVVVDHAVEAARPSCENVRHALHVALPNEPIYVHADPARLSQVIGNLLANAIKFTEPGGVIHLRVERDNDRAVIRVADNGIGIAADQLSRIFELFTQVDTSLERSRGGLGIGLTLLKTLVEMHDGTVEAHSAGLGRGSEFVVRLPIVVAAPDELASPARTEPTRLERRRILVVDDNRDSAESLAMLLSLSGSDTQVAFDGLEALRAAEELRPNIILCDIGLPKLNGYEVARKIREQPWGRSIVLIALTGWGQDEDRRRSSEAGFDGHLVKPVELGALTKLLSDMRAGESAGARSCDPQ